MNFDPFENLIGIEEASVYTGFTTRHIRLLLNRGKIKGKKIGRDWVTTKAEIDKYLSQDRKPGRKLKTP
jgi:excisionase family DNA binding protein